MKLDTFHGSFRHQKGQVQDGARPDFSGGVIFSGSLVIRFFRSLFQGVLVLTAVCHERLKDSYFSKISENR